MTRLSVGVALVAFCASLGCSRGPEPQWDVTGRLAPESGASRNRSHPCAVGREIRPAWGCPRRARLTARGPDGGRRRFFRLGRNLVGRDLLVIPRVRSGAKEAWNRLPPQVVRDAPAVISVEIREDARFAEATAFVIPPVRRRVRSRPFSPRPGAVLQGGIALEPMVPADRSAAVEFRIVAHAKGRTELVHREVVVPGHDTDWLDYAISLDRFAGEDLALEFETSFETPATSPDVLAFPLWSVPAVLNVAPKTRPSFVVVSLDTLRADHVGVYGAPAGSTPILDAIAAEGVVFDRATTTFPSTTGAHMSLFTGLYPSSHRVRAPPTILSRAIPTLTQVLASAGYRTAAVTENGMIVAGAGFDRGFDFYVEFKEAKANVASGHVDEVVDTATKWLSEHGDEQFFLFVHTYEVHAPYRPPPEFDRYPVPDDGRPLPRARAAYRGGVSYTDHEIGRLVAALDSPDLSGRTVLMVLSDHGEAFGEHGVFGHGRSLIEELVHVPLLVRAPGLVPGARHIGQPVSLVDVAPTILELAGVGRPPAMQGQSLLPMLSGDDEGGRGPVYSEMGGARAAHTLAVRDGDLKWIYSAGEGAPQVFDLSGGEEAELESASPEVLSRGRELRRRFTSRVRGRAGGEATGSAEKVEIDETTEGQLRALGYIE